MALTWLLLDLNAYFASVEQELEPGLRGRPVAVAPVQSASGACIAVSYEAKARGVRTGTRVGEALELCPDLAVVPPRHKVYVEFHHRIIAAADRVLPVERVLSIDEMAGRLDPRDRTPEGAREVVRRVKASIRERVGACLRCSVGVAPNVFLAKVASDMQKPDGMVLLDTPDLPHALNRLELIDLPGIGRRMRERLESLGITSVERLCAMSEPELARAWGSVVGARWWYLLRGHDLHDEPTRRRSVGHQHVLAPQRRTDTGAREVALRMLHKAAARMRHLGYAAGGMTLSIRFTDRTGWHAPARFPQGTQDTLALTDALAGLWGRRPGRTPMQVGVTLHDLVPPASYTPPLFGTDRRRGDLAAAIDAINARHGPLTVYPAAIHHARSSAPGGIAFRSIPDLALPDSVGAPEPGGRRPRPPRATRPGCARDTASAGDGAPTDPHAGPHADPDADPRAEPPGPDERT